MWWEFKLIVAAVATLVFGAIWHACQQPSNSDERETLSPELGAYLKTLDKYWRIVHTICLFCIWLGIILLLFNRWTLIVETLEKNAPK